MYEFAKMKYHLAMERLASAQDAAKEAKNAASLRVRLAQVAEAERDARAAKMMMDATAG